MEKVSRLRASAKRQALRRINCSDEEWQLRVDLACAYRLFFHLGWHRMVYNHISVRVPNSEHFLINPFGLLYREVTASNLLKIDLDGNKVVSSKYDVLKAGFVVHSAVHKHRRDANCVMHTHSVAGTAVSCLKDGLIGLDLGGMAFTNRIAYHDVEGVTLETDESERIAVDLGDKAVMILRNHGLLAVGETIGDAFQDLYQLERACEVQLAAQASGARLNLPSRDIQELVGRQSDPKVAMHMKTGNALQWDAMRRWMEDIDPGFDS